MLAVLGLLFQVFLFQRVYDIWHGAARESQEYAFANRSHLAPRLYILQSLKCPWSASSLEAKHSNSEGLIISTRLHSDYEG